MTVSGIAVLIVLRLLRDQLQLRFVQRRIKCSIVFDGQIVTSTLINRVENFLQRDDSVGVAALEWDWNRWQFVEKCPCINIAAWPTIRSTDDRVKIARR